MSTVDDADRVDLDEVVTEFQGHMSLMFTRARSLWRESAAMVHPDLQPSGYKLLTHIARVGSSNAHQLSECFEMDKSAISRQVRMLEDAGLIESRPDESDGRLRVLTATAAARELLASVRSHHSNRIRAAISGLTPDEMRVASMVFSRLAEI